MSHLRRITLIVIVAYSCLAPLSSFAMSQAVYNEINAPLYTGSCAAATAGTGGAAAPGDNNATIAYAYLMGKGLNSAAAAGIVGNMIYESGVGPERLQSTPASQVTTAAQVISQGDVNSGSIGWGLVQWTPPNQVITSGNPPPAVNTLYGQLDDLWAELTTADASFLATYKGETNAATAATDFEVGFERGTPAIERSIAAQALFEYGANKTPLPASILANIVGGSASNVGTPGSATTGASACGAGATGPVGACANPLRAVKFGSAGVFPLRVDQGVDYEGTGPIYPICNAQIIMSEPDAAAGWPGDGDFIAYKLLGNVLGKLTTGKVVYFSEDCKSVVTVSAKILTDQDPICNMNQGGTNIETGWTAANILTSALGGTDPFWNGGSATNYGLNFSAMLKALGAPPGTTLAGISKTPLPAGWPTWP